MNVANLNLNTLIMVGLIALLVATGGWVRKAESRVSVLEAELNTPKATTTGYKMFWRHTATWSEINEIERALNCPSFPWPLDNFNTP